MEKTKIFIIAILLFTAIEIRAQVAITTDGSSADPSAMLDIKSIEKGLLIPRMTEADRNNIVSPAEGVMVYQTDVTAGFYFYNGTEWTAIAEKNNTSYTTWVMIDEITLSADAPNITFSGLNGNSDGEYRIIGQFKCSTGGAVIILRPNDDQAYNYYQSGNAGSGWSTGNYFGFTIGYVSNSGNWTICDGVLQSSIARPRVLMTDNLNDISGGVGFPLMNANVMYRTLWRNTTDEITSLVISTTQGAGVLTSGSHVELWAKRTINL